MLTEVRQRKYKLKTTNLRPTAQWHEDTVNKKNLSVLVKSEGEFEDEI